MTDARMTDTRMTGTGMTYEIREAISAGEQALVSLQTAWDHLNGARNWGIADLLGGGLLSGFFKHARMNDASYSIEAAKRDLQLFQRELKDVEVMPADVRIDVGSFLLFADFFFDGLVADYLVQSRINEARSQVWDTMERVETLLGELKRYS